MHHTTPEYVISLGGPTLIQQSGRPLVPVHSRTSVLPDTLGVADQLPTGNATTLQPHSNPTISRKIVPTGYPRRPMPRFSALGGRYLQEMAEQRINHDSKQLGPLRSILGFASIGTLHFEARSHRYLIKVVLYGQSSVGPQPVTVDTSC